MQPSVEKTPLEWAIVVWNYPIISVDGSPITFGNVCVGTILIIGGFHAAKRISRRLATKVFPKIAPDPSYINTFERLSFYALVVFLTLFALRLANVPLTVFTVLGGAFAIGVGFGSQNIINNFISGLILMIERPIKIGDFIEADGVTGTVEHIGIRSTRLLLFDNKHMILPNASFLEKNVLNWTLSSDVIRTTVSVGVAYGSATDKVRELLLKAALHDDRILKQPEPVVLFTNFGDNALSFELIFWVRVRNQLSKRKIESDIRLNVDKLFREADITISYPQRDVHLDTLHPIEVRMLDPTQ